MPVSIIMNNLAVISGIITPNFRPYPGNPGKTLCMTDFAVKRLSGYTDYIPISMSRKAADIMNRHIGEYIWTAGRFASCNYQDPEGSHLNLSLLMESFAFLDNTAKSENSIFLDGYISRQPVLRTTPLGCRITDLLVAINYPHQQSDYIPCICWNNNALAASRFPCGTHVHIWGRIQSRNYKKITNEGKICKRIALHCPTTVLSTAKQHAIIKGLYNTKNAKTGISVTGWTDADMNKNQNCVWRIHRK